MSSHGHGVDHVITWTHPVAQVIQLLAQMQERQLQALVSLQQQQEILARMTPQNDAKVYLERIEGVDIQD